MNLSEPIRMLSIVSKFQNKKFVPKQDSNPFSNPLKFYNESNRLPPTKKCRIKTYLAV